MEKIIRVRGTFSLTRFFASLALMGALASAASAAAPAAPSNLVATAASSRQINLTWQDKATNETNYYVSRSPNGSSSWTVIATLGANVTSYQNTGLSQNTTYYYRVRCKTGSTYSSYSSTANAKTATLAAPTALVVAVASASQLNLSWTDNTTYETNYYVERATASGGPYTQTGSLGASVTAYSDTGLSASVTYYYRVRAYDGINYSAYSSAVNQTIRAITASAGANGAISPNGTSAVANGSNQAFTMTPNPGYMIATVTVDGGPVATNPTYTFSNITANHTISATFSLNAFTITASAGANGSISPSGSVAVNSGATATFTITPNAGYTISDVQVDGAPTGAVSAYTFTSVTTNHTLFASFADVTAPTGSLVINSGAAYTNSATVTLGLIAFDTGSGMAQMRFSNDNITWTAAEPYAAEKTWTLTTGDDTKTVYVQFKDVDGNWSSAYSSSIILDTVPPSVTITSPVAGYTNNTTPTLTYSVSDGAVVVKVDGLVVSKVSGNMLDTLAAGPHTVTVEATDAAVNIGSAQVSFTMDTYAPFVSIDSPSAPITNNALTLTGSLESGALLSVTANTSASPGPVSYPTPTAWSCAISGLTAGPNTITVTVADAAGNTSSAGITLDPTLLGLWHLDGDWKDASGNNNNGTAYNGATFSASAYMGSQAGGFDGVNDYTAMASTLLTSASNTFTIEFWANPTATRAVTTESTGGTSGGSGQRYALAPVYGGSVDAGAGVSVGTNGISVFEHAGSYLPSLLVYSPSLSLTGWNHIVIVYENKQPKLYLNGQFIKAGLRSTKTNVYPSAQFGNVATYGPYKGLIDEVAIYKRALSAEEIAERFTFIPAPSITITSPGSGVTNNTTPLLNYTVYNGGLVTIKVDGNVVSKVSGSNLEALSDGTHTVRVEVVNSAGKTGLAEVTFTVDTAPPTLSINPVTSPSDTAGQTISGTMSAGSTVTVAINTSAVAGSMTYPTSTTWSCALTQLALGENTITITATDGASNTTTATASITTLAAVMTNVVVSSNTLNASRSEEATVFFTISSQATVTFSIIPEKLGPTGTPKYQAARTCAAGACSFAWAGKDNAGTIVPDEAYLYVLKASNGICTTDYSPAAPTGTGSVSCSQASGFDPYKNDPLTITYGVSSQPERVFLNINQSGVKYKLMDSVPHVPGSYTFDWNGRNSAGKLVLGSVTAECSATLLRENVIVTTGDTPIVTLLKTDPYEVQLSYGEITRIKYTLSRDANVSISLTPSTGSAITVLNSQAQTAGPQEIEWRGLDASDASGKKVLISQEGDYLVSIQAMNPATGSSSTTKGSLRIWQ